MATNRDTSAILAIFLEAPLEVNGLTSTIMNYEIIGFFYINNCARKFFIEKKILDHVRGSITNEFKYHLKELDYLITKASTIIGFFFCSISSCESYKK